MFSPFERFVAFRYLRARREDGLISLIALFSLVGIALGVTTLIVVLAVMNGVREEMIKSIIGLEGHIAVYSNARGGIANYDELSRKIAGMPGVKNAIPKVDGQVMASFKGASTGAMVVGLKPEDLARKELLSGKITRSVGGIIIGSRMAERLGLRPGDELMLISPEGRATVAGLMPRIKSYPVGGTFSLGMFMYDNGLVLLPFEEAQTYFKLREGGADNATLIEVMLDKAGDSEALAHHLSQELGTAFRVHDWQSSNSHILNAVIIQRNVMFLILMLIILVASFNIVSSLIMLVREKGRDIAILRTMGASRTSIMRIFFACGASIGVIGTLGGVCLGLLIAFNTESIQLWLETLMGHKLFNDELYFLSHLPAKVKMREVLMVVAMALGLSFLATLYPARRAAALDPAEGLRYE